MASKLTPVDDIEIRQPLQRRILRPIFVALSKYVYSLITTGTGILNRVGQSFRRLQTIVGPAQKKAATPSTQDTYLLMISFETDGDPYRETG